MNRRWLVMGIEGWRCFRAVLLLILLSFGLESAGYAGAGTVTGTLVFNNGRPADSCMVFFFNADIGPPPSPDLYWRVPNRVIAAGPDGVFRIDIPEGKYYIGTVKRRPDSRQDTPRGDEFYHLAVDSTGRPRPVNISAGAVKDLGIVTIQKQADRHSAEDRITSVEGTISDESDGPSAGYVVNAYTDRQLKGEPLFVSESTGSDGRFLLRVTGDATYYLQVRDVRDGRSLRLKNHMEEHVVVRIRAGEMVKGIEIVIIASLKTSVGKD